MHARADSLGIAIADDAVLFREGLASLLTQFGHTVTDHFSDATTMETPLLAADPGALLDLLITDLLITDLLITDLLITDVRMPPEHQDDGLKAALAIRQAQPSLSILVLSQYPGNAYATQLLLTRPGGRAAFYLYGAVDPAWWEATWPPGVPAQAHQTADDPWREKEAEDAFVAKVPGAELFVYDGATHLFADPSTDDFDATAAALAMERIQAFLGALG